MIGKLNVWQTRQDKSRQHYSLRVLTEHTQQIQDNGLFCMDIVCNNNTLDMPVVSA